MKNLFSISISLFLLFVSFLPAFIFSFISWFSFLPLFDGSIVPKIGFFIYLIIVSIPLYVLSYEVVERVSGIPVYGDYGTLITKFVMIALFPFFLFSMFFISMLPLYLFSVIQVNIKSYIFLIALPFCLAFPFFIYKAWMKDFMENVIDHLLKKMNRIHYSNSWNLYEKTGFKQKGLLWWNVNLSGEKIHFKDFFDYLWMSQKMEVETLDKKGEFLKEVLKKRREITDLEAKIKAHDDMNDLFKK